MTMMIDPESAATLDQETQATLGNMLIQASELLADPVERSLLRRAVEAMTEVGADVVGFEVANKQLPQIRRRAEDDVPSILTKGGNPRIGDSSAVLVSIIQLARIVARIVATVEAGATQRPADAILLELDPISGKGGPIEIRLRGTEEAVGGRNRL